jgi:hypothetical protein
VIDVVQPYAGAYQAHIYAESPQVPPPNQLLPPIQCKTKVEALAEARKRIDELLWG